MANAPIEIWEMQVAFAIGLLGIYVGWRGTIAKMTGFYDLSGAVKTLLFGIISGGIAATAIDSLILIKVLSETQNIISLGVISLIIALAESSFALFVLGRSRTVELRACAPYGWTLGLGLGAMRSSYLNVRLFDPEVWNGTGFSISNIGLACVLTVITCLGHASITTWQGSKIIENNRFRPLIYGTVARSALILVTVLTIFFPLILALVAPIILWSWFPAQESWLPSGLTPAARQAYRRTLRQADLNKSRADSRVRGKIVESEE
ncbi:MAG TPA: hypothetical protein QF821_02710 [Candidatus Thalassarchaeaceae archaeon]|jgi:hypothetical protein|nr:hypothetical protein [Candidatus Thalassarchaeaceae archaeon]